jgi:hypothetical protein
MPLSVASPICSENRKNGSAADCTESCVVGSTPSERKISVMAAIGHVLTDQIRLSGYATNPELTATRHAPHSGDPGRHEPNRELAMLIS